MGWLEDRHAERTSEVHAMNPQVGQFVNLMDCFGDIWSEILHVFPPRDDGMGGSIVVARHRDGRKDTEYTFYHNVRKIANREDLTMDNARKIYTQDHVYTDSFSNEPGEPIEVFMGGFRATMRYRIMNRRGVPVAEAKRLDTAKNLWRMLKDRESLRLKDTKTRMYMDWGDSF